MAQKRKVADTGREAQQNKKRIKSAQRLSIPADSIYRYKAYAVLPAEADAAEDRGHYVASARLGNGFDWDFVVETAKGVTQWQAIRKYKNVKLTDNVFAQGDIIYVMNNESMPDLPGEDKSDVEHLRWEQKNYWVAKIIEARAQSDKEVLLLVAWLYWPNELPNKSYRPWHGQGETILSNSLDVIDAMTISAKANDLLPYNEFEDNEVGRLPERYWRQTFDARHPTKKESLSQLREFCRCQQPHLPGTKMYQCARSECQKWLHQQCLIDEVGEQVWSYFQSHDMDSYVASHKPKPTESLAKAIMTAPVQVLGQLLTSSIEHKLEEGVQAVKQETAVKLEAHEVSQTNGTTKKKGKSKRTEPSWRSQLEISIIVEDNKSLYARVKTKKKDGHKWDVSVACLCCHKTLE